MSVKNYSCLKGWLLAPSPTDGTNVPFFLHVRGKDIVWDDSDFPADLIRISKSGDNRTMKQPQSSVNFLYGGWDITANSDYSYEATKKVSVGSGGFTFNDEDDTDLAIKILFPFLTAKDNQLSVVCTINGLNEELATSNVNILFDVGYTSDNVTVLNVHLRNLIYKFHEKYDNMDSYINSYVFIRVHGNMKLDLG